MACHGARLWLCLLNAVVCLVEAYRVFDAFDESLKRDIVSNGASALLRIEDLSACGEILLYVTPSRPLHLHSPAHEVFEVQIRHEALSPLRFI